MTFLLRTVATAASLWVATLLVPGLNVTGAGFVADPQTDYIVALLISAVAFGLLNAFVKPILLLLSLPITCATLGLFVIVVNGLILVILSLLPVGFHVDGLVSAILGGLIVSITSFVLSQVVPG
ncbi:MAG: phage holin family protein [Chloroflexi bacterium]|nr:phage holin family protein [Chloroflexota bacterium]